MNKAKAEAAIIDALTGANIAFTISHASTGSVYIYVGSRDRDCADAVVRVSDHGECYPPQNGERRIDVSPDGITAKAAVKMLLAEEFPKNIPVYREPRPKGNSVEISYEDALAACAVIPAEVLASVSTLSNNQRNLIAAEYGVAPRALWRVAAEAKYAH